MASHFLIPAIHFALDPCNSEEIYTYLKSSKRGTGLHSVRFKENKRKAGVSLSVDQKSLYEIVFLLLYGYL